MPINDQDNTRPDPTSHARTGVPTPTAPTRQSSRKDVRTLGTNAYNSAGSLGSDPTYYKSHFGCARGVFWAIVFEAGLAIAVLLCWQLRLLPRW
jgi:hypothetical protein